MNLVIFFSSYAPMKTGVKFSRLVVWWRLTIPKKRSHWCENGAKVQKQVTTAMDES